MEVEIDVNSALVQSLLWEFMENNILSMTLSKDLHDLVDLDV